MISNSYRIPDWIAKNSRVLDLGCGDGRLLAQLIETHAIDALGLELDPDKITNCL
ncbi:MAG: methionine biosynthesis protein MetW, partial [Litorivicinaceae bacterium]